MLILERLPSSSSSISTTTLSSDSERTSVEFESSSSIPKIKTKNGTSGGHPAQQRVKQKEKAREMNEIEGGSNSIKTNGDIAVPRVLDSNGAETAKWNSKTYITLDFPDVYL